jgi:hypothetical protein
MHTLFFDSHTAILDPDSGIGVLVLPDAANDAEPAHSADLPAAVAVPSWFGVEAGEYDTIMRQLAGIGWELPRDPHGRPCWWDAGSTDCCGRTMIALRALGPGTTSPARQDLVSASQRIQDLAAWACCGMDALREPLPQLISRPGDAG